MKNYHYSAQDLRDQIAQYKSELSHMGENLIKVNDRFADIHEKNHESEKLMEQRDALEEKIKFTIDLMLRVKQQLLQLIESDISSNKNQPPSKDMQGPRALPLETMLKLQKSSVGGEAKLSNAFFAEDSIIKSAYNRHGFLSESARGPKSLPPETVLGLPESSVGGEAELSGEFFTALSLPK